MRPISSGSGRRSHCRDHSTASASWRQKRADPLPTRFVLRCQRPSEHPAGPLYQHTTIIWPSDRAWQIASVGARPYWMWAAGSASLRPSMRGSIPTRLLGIDRPPASIARAQEQAKVFGLTNVQFECLDLDHTTSPRSFDLILTTIPSYKLTGPGHSHL